VHRRRRIFLEQLQNDDLNDDEALLAIAELFKYGWLQETPMPTRKVVVRGVQVRDLSPQLKADLDAAPEDIVRVIVDAQRAGDVADLLALVDRMGRTAAKRGLTEEKLAELLDDR
jgi:hypothetical protein